MSRTPAHGDEGVMRGPDFSLLNRADDAVNAAAELLRMARELRAARRNRPPRQRASSNPHKFPPRFGSDSLSRDLSAASKRYIERSRRLLAKKVIKL